MNVAHESVELFVAGCVPLCDFGGEVADCAEKVEPGHASGVEYRHEDLHGSRLKLSPR